MLKSSDLEAEVKRAEAQVELLDAEWERISKAQEAIHARRGALIDEKRVAYDEITRLKNLARAARIVEGN